MTSIERAKQIKQQQKGQPQVQPKSKLDSLLWVVVGVLLASAVVLNSYLSQVAWSLRLSGWILVIIAAVLIGFQTRIGKQLWAFSKDSRMELRKVVWPTRQETTRATLMIVAMVVVVSLILWGVDSILMWAINWLTGQSGG